MKRKEMKEDEKEMAKNCFRMIALAAASPVPSSTPGVSNPYLLSLVVIESQCGVLRQVLGDGDGMEE